MCFVCVSAAGVGSELFEKDEEEFEVDNEYNMEGELDLAIIIGIVVIILIAIFSVIYNVLKCKNAPTKPMSARSLVEKEGTEMDDVAVDVEVCHLKCNCACRGFWII